MRIDGWQQDGVSEVFYAAPGKRILSVLVGEAARKALVTGKSEDVYKRQPDSRA